MVTKYEEHELESLLFDVVDQGYVIMHISKLWRLLGKGSRAAGTWVALLDAWQEIRETNKRSDLRICELPGEYIFLSRIGTDSVRNWAGEVSH